MLFQDNIPNEIYLQIFKWFTADTLQNALSINKTFNDIVDSNYIWKKVYNNTIPNKFINWGSDDFKLLLKANLAILKHTSWFKRQMFIRFLYDNIIANEFAKPIKCQLLIDSFMKYSNGKFSTLPTSWYWNNLEECDNKNIINKMLTIAQSCDCILSEYNGKYINWNFPDKNGYINGIEFMNSV